MKFGRPIFDCIDATKNQTIVTWFHVGGTQCVGCFDMFWLLAGCCADFKCLKTWKSRWLRLQTWSAPNQVTWHLCPTGRTQWAIHFHSGTNIGKSFLADHWRMFFFTRVERVSYCFLVLRRQTFRNRAARNGCNCFFAADPGKGTGMACVPTKTFSTIKLLKIRCFRKIAGQNGCRCGKAITQRKRTKGIIRPSFTSSTVI